MGKAMMYSCSCCGADVTVPYFHKGTVYGYTCIKKVDPSAKKVKDAGLWVAVDSVAVSVVEEDRNLHMLQRRYQIVAEVSGHRFREVVRGSADNARRIMAAAKLMKVSEVKSGASYIWPRSMIRNPDNVGQLANVDPEKEKVLLIWTPSDYKQIARCL